MDWHRSRKADALLRLGGLAALATAAGGWALLFGGARAGTGSRALDALVGLVAFAASSAAASLLALGRHLFDEVEVSRPWLPPRRDPRR